MISVALLSDSALRDGVDVLVRLVEATGALVIFAGAVIAAVRFLAAAVRPGRDRDFTRVRIGLSRYLVLGLEFQLASDVLSTAVAPTFEEIGQLAAIAAIRTTLNHFLGKELAAERAELARAGVSAQGVVRPCLPLAPCGRHATPRPARMTQRGGGGALPGAGRARPHTS